MKKIVLFFAALFAVACGSENDGGETPTPVSLLGAWVNVEGIDNAPDNEIIGAEKLIFAVFLGYEENPDVGYVLAGYNEGNLTNGFHIDTPGTLHLSRNDYAGNLVYEYWMDRDILYFKLKVNQRTEEMNPISAPVGTVYSYREYTPDPELEEEKFQIEVHLRMAEDALGVLILEIEQLETALEAETDPYKKQTLEKKLQEKKAKRETIETMIREIKEKYGLT